MIKALTLWQPYAGAVILGLKQYETRGWKTNHRGTLAIHAAMKKMPPEYKTLADKYGMKELSYGAVIGTVELIDCILMTDEFISAQTKTEIDFGDWRVGRYAWKLGNVRKFDKPVQCPGKQGLWNWNGM